MRGFVIGTVVTAVAFYILVTLLPSMFSYDGGVVGLIVIAVIFGIINGLIGPIVKTVGVSVPVAFVETRNVSCAASYARSPFDP